jgi:hypothetical protein
MQIKFLHRNGYTVTLVLCFYKERASGVISNGKMILLNATPQEAVDEIKTMDINHSALSTVKLD